MARQVTKCGNCGGIMWIGTLDDSPQSCVCLCGTTELSEDGPSGAFVELTSEELAEVP